ncbi:MAG: hypothetical protein JSU63_17160 [Phycisphaerales bacterium]|nr:MAG: hypothetical protein JSU63_17160 [Phycisphaerales bacterium]
MLRKAVRLIPGVLICSVMGIPASAWGEQPRSYEDHKLVRVELQTQEDLDTLEKTGAIILNCHIGVGPLDVVVSPQQLIEVSQIGRKVSVLHDNIQELIDRERKPRLRADVFDDFFLDYHPYDGGEGSIIWYMSELVSRYPDLASMVNVGQTLLGRPIWGLRINGDAISDEPAVVYFGGQHAREWITTTVPTYLATHLLQAYSWQQTTKDLVDNVEFFLIPVFNVDGYERTWDFDRLWRKNLRQNSDGTLGVDLNRNWGTGWGLDIGSSSDPSSEIYRGTAKFSEPETQALRDFFIDHPNVRAQLDIHSYSQLILWPWGYKPDLPLHQDIYEEVGTAMQQLIHGVHGQTYTAGPGYTTIYPVSGGSLDWTYAARNILSYAFECRPPEANPAGFVLPPDQIIPNNQELLPAIRHLANSDWVRAPIRFAFPEGQPQVITPGVETTIEVKLVEQFEDVVPGTGRMYYRYHPETAFIETALTSIGGQIYQAVMPPTNCTAMPEYYFTVQASDGTTITNPRTAPTGETYTSTMCSGNVTFFSEDLSTDPGWTCEGDWEWGQPTGCCPYSYSSPDPTAGYTGLNVYGYNLDGWYPKALPETNLTSHAIDCTGRSGVHLTFWRWLGVRGDFLYGGPDDQAAIRVKTSSTPAWTTVWHNRGAVYDDDWEFQDIDISTPADGQPEVLLRWVMGESNYYTLSQACGWNIDDIELYSATCDGITGDCNADGDVDETDFAEFLPCYSGFDAPLAPLCAIFDFDEDGDVDCIDWGGFCQVWTGSGDPPEFTTCDCAAPLSEPEAVRKNRYISFNPNNADVTVALQVEMTDGPGDTGIVGWVGEPYDGGCMTDQGTPTGLPCSNDLIARVVSDPVFRTWPEGLLHVSGCEIVPVAGYAIRATSDMVVFSDPLMLGTIHKPGEKHHGDVVGIATDTGFTPPQGVVNVTDIQAHLLVAAGAPNAPHRTWTDVHGLGIGSPPNFIANVSDLQQLLFGNEGRTYLESNPENRVPADCP